MEENKVLNKIEADEEKVKKYQKMFRDAYEFKQGRHKNYMENMACYQGDQSLISTADSQKPWVVKMNTPHASVAIDTRVSSIVTSDYLGSLEALSAEDVEKVDILSQLYKAEWKRMKLDEIIDDVIGTAAVVREAYVHVFYNYDAYQGGTGNRKKGRLEAYMLEPGSIFIDPNARVLKQAAYMGVCSRTNKVECIREYPEYKEELELINSGLTPEERGENYIANDYTTNQDGVITKLVFYETTKTKDVIKRTTMIENVIVEVVEDMPLNTYPIVQFRWKKAAQSVYGLSLMDDLIKLQKAINSIESATTNTALAYASPQLLVNKASGLNPKMVAQVAGVPGIVYGTDIALDNTMKPVTPPQVSDTIISIKDNFVNMIDKISGANNQFLGDLGSAGNTAGGAQTAVNRALIIETKVLNNVREFIGDLTDVIVGYIRYLYSDDEDENYSSVASIKEKNPIDGKSQFKSIIVPNLKGIEYEYSINMEAKSKYAKDKEKAKLLELYQMQNQYGSPIKLVNELDIVKAFSMEHEPEFIKRYKYMTQMTSEKKAEAIMQLTELASQVPGLPPTALNSAISEIISDATETPALDALTEALNAGLAQQQAQAQGLEQRGQAIQELAQEQMPIQ